MTYIQLDSQNVSCFINNKNEVEQTKEKIQEFHKKLHHKTGLGNEFLGWMTLPEQMDEKQLVQIEHTAKRIREQYDYFVVIGIGGSYLGAYAAIQMLTNEFQEDKNGTKVLFVGQNMSQSYLHQALDFLKDKNFAVNVISKSGTTLEPALAFRLFRLFLEDKYGEAGARERIYVTTDGSRGILRKLSMEKGYEMFEIPDDIGGRFSVLTPVGLLPIAAAGISVREMMKGAQCALHQLSSANVEENIAYEYAMYRYLLYKSGKKIEILTHYEPCLHGMGEWWKQLAGESEGKNGKGIFPATLTYSTDLHAMGQYIQEGERHIFETVMWIQEPSVQMEIAEDPLNLDGLNYLVGESIHAINEKAFLGTLRAHIEGNVPNFIIYIPKCNAFSFGYLVYFFELAIAMSGYLNEINPFDQPGVEAYKKHMFSLLSKKSDV